MKVQYCYAMLEYIFGLWNSESALWKISDHKYAQAILSKPIFWRRNYYYSYEYYDKLWSIHTQLKVSLPIIRLCPGHFILSSQNCQQ